MACDQEFMECRIKIGKGEGTEEDLESEVGSGEETALNRGRDGNGSSEPPTGPVND